MSDAPQDPPPQERARARMLRLVDGETPPPRGKNPYIPDDYPLVPIGVGPGKLIIFLDSHGQLQMQSARDIARNALVKFFSAQPNYLIRAYPRPRKGQNSDEADTFRPELACDQLVYACGWEGPWEPKRKLRGRGAWEGEDQTLVLHCGDKLWIDGRLHPVGRRGDLVYPRGAATMRPAREPQAGPNGPGDQLLELLDKWRWQRPALDATLLCGWIGSALIGGALPTRPAVWLTGLKNAGKSLLQGVLRDLFDRGAALVQSSDTTAAGVWQTLGFDCMPVALDEMESTIDNRRLDMIVTLMRSSFSGGDVQRGGQDGEAHQYPVRSSFLFSSINIVPLRAQDRSRCAVLELQPLDATAPFVVPFGELPSLGRRLLRRMVDGYARLLGEVLPAYRAGLVARGFDGRGADTLGTLFACANVLREDYARVDDDLDYLGPELASILEMQRTEEAPDGEHVVNHLCDSLVEPWRGGEKRPIGELIRQAAGYGVARIGVAAQLAPTAPEAMSEADAERVAQHDDAAREAARALANFGMKRLLLPSPITAEPAWVVAIANSSPALQEIFRGTHWQGMSGTLGGWRQPLSRLPGAFPAPVPVRFRGSTQRAVCVPQALFLRLRPDEQEL